MMLPSHLLASVLLGLLLARRGWGRREWLLALGFGVLIDADHALQLPRYLLAHGWDALTPGAMLAWGGEWQGFLHTPWALVPVAAAALWARSWIPPVFWGLHMAQDFVVARHLVHFGGPVEWVIVGVLAALVGATLHAGRRGAPFGEHVRRTFGLPPARPSASADPEPAPA